MNHTTRRRVIGGSVSAVLTGALLLTACMNTPSTGIGAVGNEILVPFDGLNQSAPVGTILPAPLVVAVVDEQANPIANATVTWSVSTGGGTLSDTTGTTDSQGRAQVSWTLGSEVGVQSVQATVGSYIPAVFTATAIAATSRRTR